MFFCYFEALEASSTSATLPLSCDGCSLWPGERGLKGAVFRNTIIYLATACDVEAVISGLAL